MKSTLEFNLHPTYPTPEHKDAALAIVDFFRAQPVAEAVLLVNSCARGKATRDSCLDIVVLVSPEKKTSFGAIMELSWLEYYHGDEVFKSLLTAGAYAEVHLDIVDGQYNPQPRDWTGGPDSFEVEIGNHLAYSVLLWERGNYLQHLKDRWLPYYNEDLREGRLALVRKFCLNNLRHIELFVPRGLYFQSFDRLYNAFKEFLQALFITRRTYPIAYDKWIREQIVDILKMPELYNQMVDLLGVCPFEGVTIAQKARQLESLLEEHTG